MTPNAPPGNFRQLKFIEIANKYSNDEYVMRFVGGPEVMSAIDIPSAIKNGVAEIGNSLYTAIAPLSPGVFPILHAEITWPEMQKVGAADYIQELFHKGGLRHLIIQNSTPTQQALWIWGKKPIRKIEDFKGLKMGNPSPVFLPLWQALGTEQLLAQLNDFYEAMSRGLFDTYIISLELVPTYKLQEVTKYGLNTTFASGTSAFYMNLDTWNRLSKTAQQNLSKACDEFDAGLVKWYADSVFNPAKAQIEKAGVEFITLSLEDDKKFHDTYRESVWASEIKKNPETATKLKQLLTKSK